jgi:hypothetical protein
LIAADGECSLAEISWDECDGRWLCCDVAQTVATMRGQLLLGRTIVGCACIEIYSNRARGLIGKCDIAIGAMKE